MNGKIIKIYGRHYNVLAGGRVFDCSLRGAIRRDERMKRFSDPAAVGDEVEFEILDDGSGLITSICDRRNMFSRKDSSSRKEDVIAANIDRIVVIQCYGEPRLNPRFVDRILVRGMKESVETLLFINKSDLADDFTRGYIQRYYALSGLRIIEVSALDGSGIDDVRELLGKGISVFTGYSGVGKSSILNSVYPGLELRTTDVSESTGKGRHTTTNVQLVMRDEGCGVIDTPGMREFGLMDIEPEDLQDFFPEFAKLRGRCRFSGCTHDHEPQCEVKDHVERGDIDEDRYISYLNILNSLKEYRARRY